MAESAAPRFELLPSIQRNRWLWPLVGSLIWAIVSVITGRFGL